MAISGTRNKVSPDDDPESLSYHSDPDVFAKAKDDSDSDGMVHERRPSRIAPIRTGSVAESRISVGKQLESEADNAIKYRTCSWQKVR